MTTPTKELGLADLGATWRSLGWGALEAPQDVVAYWSAEDYAAHLNDLTEHVDEVAAAIADPRRPGSLFWLLRFAIALAITEAAGGSAGRETARAMRAWAARQTLAARQGGATS